MSPVWIQCQLQSEHGMVPASYCTIPYSYWTDMYMGIPKQGFWLCTWAQMNSRFHVDMVSQQFLHYTIALRLFISEPVHRIYCCIPHLVGCHDFNPTTGCSCQSMKSQTICRRAYHADTNGMIPTMEPSVDLFDVLHAELFYLQICVHTCDCPREKGFSFSVVASACSEHAADPLQ
jgi:hypothetical protein